MRAIALLLLLSTSASAGTIRNADSCDISVMPAATLLLPFFEVDIASPAESAQTTLFTIVNTSPEPQIAHVTLWTDWAYPVLDFPLYLTGFDVQAINLRDVLVSGTIATTGSGTSPGARSLGSNPRFLADAAASCTDLPAQIPAGALAEVRAALALGILSECGTARVGAAHTNAIGYATIDVVATCSAHRITDTRALDELLFDNVLTGDWQIVMPRKDLGNLAAGNPLVHIRAIPEGGKAGVRAESNLPYTFYDRFTGPQRRLADRRQPLPSSFAVRFIQGGADLSTDFLVWREGVTGAGAGCADAMRNSVSHVSVIVRFDERENPLTLADLHCVCGTSPRPSIPAAARIASANSRFPPLASGDVGGWFAFNLDNEGSTDYGVTPSTRNFRPPGTSTIVGPRPSQNWIVPMLFAEGRFGVAFDAIVLANGCSPAVPGSLIGPGSRIGPGPNLTP